MNNIGSIEIITGPMFSGKTEELIRRVNRLKLADKKFLAFKPDIDDRYSENDIVSHDDKKISAKPISVDEPNNIFKYILLNEAFECHAKTSNEEREYKNVIIDEVQFFNEGIIDIIKKLAYEYDLRVICAGMDMDFRSEPWPVTSQVMACAEEVDKLKGICHKCGNEATRTQRYVNGESAHYDDPIILVGGQESYKSVCSKCYKIIK